MLEDQRSPSKDVAPVIHRHHTAKRLFEHQNPSLQRREVVGSSSYNLSALVEDRDLQICWSRQRIGEGQLEPVAVIEPELGTECLLPERTSAKVPEVIMTWLA